MSVLSDYLNVRNQRKIIDVVCRNDVSGGNESSSIIPINHNALGPIERGCFASRARALEK